MVFILLILMTAIGHFATVATVRYGATSSWSATTATFQLKVFKWQSFDHNNSTEKNEETRAWRVFWSENYQAARRREILFDVRTVCLRSRRNESISDGESIVRSFEIPRFRFGKLVEAIPECLLPPVFKFVPMFSP